MQRINGEAELYNVEASDDGSQTWLVTGPNGLVGIYASAQEAQAKADFLNEQAAQETEDDT